MDDPRIALVLEYFKQKGWTPFPFQIQAWKDYLDGKSGILNAPTGSGKTYAIWFPVLLNYIQNNPSDNVAHFAHLGGMLFGYILIKYWQKNQFRQY